MSLKNVDMESAMRRLAERRIEEAMRQGKFDNLKGAGQPIDMEPAPAEENARLTWWALRILKQNDVIPDEVKWRKQIDTLRSMLDQATDEPTVRVLVAQINDQIRKLNTLGTNALRSTMTPVALEHEILRLHERLMPVPSGEPVEAQLRVGLARPCGNEHCNSLNPIDARYCRSCGRLVVRTT